MEKHFQISEMRKYLIFKLVSLNFLLVNLKTNEDGHARALKNIMNHSGAFINLQLHFIICNFLIKIKTNHQDTSSAQNMVVVHNNYETRRISNKTNLPHILL